MSVSLNEVEATAKRATRGAGYSWGLAEDSSRATRWLCAQGMDGVEMLSSVLSQTSEENAETPLAMGAALSDRAAQLPGAPVTFADVHRPLMILPFAAMAARILGGEVTVKCATAVAVTDGCSLSLQGEFPEHASELTVESGGTLGALCPTATRATPHPAAWEALGLLGQRTFAPATEESRLHGAGAGLSDND